MSTLIFNTANAWSKSNISLSSTTALSAASAGIAILAEAYTRSYSPKCDASSLPDIFCDEGSVKGTAVGRVAALAASRHG